jgi:3-hydroxyisobutyrate dehydrogenase
VANSATRGIDREGRVGVVGLGVIGGNIARVLAQSGYVVVGYDVRSDVTTQSAAFLTPAASAAEVSADTDIALIAVFDDLQVCDVLAGEQSILSADHPCRVVAILSTVALGTIEWAHEQAASRGVALLDCGVTGGKGLRDHGKIVVFAGGDEAVLESVRPIIGSFAEPLLYMGPSGAGMKAKLARNVIHYGTWSAAWEGARLAAACGLDVTKLIQAVRVSDEWTGGTMGLLAEYGIGPGPVDPNDGSMLETARALASVAHKDLRAALKLSTEVGINLPGAALDEELYDVVVGVRELERARSSAMPA